MKFNVQEKPYLAEEDSQYSLIKIMTIWAAVALPMPYILSASLLALTACGAGTYNTRSD